MKRYIYGHTSEETAYLVENYPWGFRMKTQARFWVEENPKLGQRLVKQTKNPKTNFWCQPKKSTYTDFIFLYLDNEEKIGHDQFHIRYKEIDAIRSIIIEILKIHGFKLSNYQIKRIKKIQAVFHTLDHIEESPTEAGH